VSKASSEPSSQGTVGAQWFSTIEYIKTNSHIRAIITVGHAAAEGFFNDLWWGLFAMHEANIGDMPDVRGTAGYCGTMCRLPPVGRMTCRRQ